MTIEIVDFTNQNGDFPRYVELPEGTVITGHAKMPRIFFAATMQLQQSHWVYGALENWRILLTSHVESSNQVVLPNCLSYWLAY